MERICLINTSVPLSKQLSYKYELEMSGLVSIPKCPFIVHVKL